MNNLNLSLSILLILSGLILLILTIIYPENKTCTIESMASSLITGGIGVAVNLENK